MKRFIRRSAAFAAIGSIFPIAFLCAYALGLVQFFPLYWGLYLWPTSVLLMAADTARPEPLIFAEAIGASLITNAVYWIILGAICFGLWDLACAVRRKFRKP